MKRKNIIIELFNIYPKKGQAGRVFSVRSLAPTLVTFTDGGGKQPIVLVRCFNEQK